MRDSEKVIEQKHTLIKNIGFNLLLINFYFLPFLIELTILYHQLYYRTTPVYMVGSILNDAVASEE